MYYRITFGGIRRDPKQGELIAHPFTNPAITKFGSSINALPEFQAMPETTQRLILQIGENALGHAGVAATLYRKPLFWGMYLIGSRARHQNRVASDTDLLCVGNFNVFNDLTDRESPLHGFTATEGQTPPNYLVGYVPGKYFLRVFPKDSSNQTPLNRVDLSINHLDPSKVPDLAVFEHEKDVDSHGHQLQRIPLLKIRVTDSEPNFKLESL